MLYSIHTVCIVQYVQPQLNHSSSRLLVEGSSKHFPAIVQRVGYDYSVFQSAAAVASLTSKNLKSWRGSVGMGGGGAKHLICD
jgi:hypothetical protein